jgi:hypothetical protein
MTPDEAMRFRFTSGNFYNGQVSSLVERLNYVKQQLSVLEGMPPTKMLAHRINQKNVMIKKFTKAIRQRVSWHAGELQAAAAAGFPIAPEYEPRHKTIRTEAANVGR